MFHTCLFDFSEGKKNCFGEGLQVKVSSLTDQETLCHGNHGNKILPSTMMELIGSTVT